jgi:hypothetical protein
LTGRIPQLERIFCIVNHNVHALDSAANRGLLVAEETIRAPPTQKTRLSDTGIAHENDFNLRKHSAM